MITTFVSFLDIAKNLGNPFGSVEYRLLNNNTKISATLAELNHRKMYSIKILKRKV